MAEHNEQIRRHIVFHGWVQGVGFRYWCRNNWDGSVTMEIQGTEEQIDQVILAVEAGRFVKIENMESRIIPIKEESGFHIE